MVFTICKVHVDFIEILGRVGAAGWSRDCSEVKVCAATAKIAGGR